MIVGGGTVITLNGFAVPVLAPAAQTGRWNVEHDRLQFRLQLSSAVPRRLADRLFRDQQRESRRHRVNAARQTWKACWVHALAGSNPASSAL
jgi:hypothetical protein